MSRRPLPNNNRQESHRVYLQQYLKDEGVGEEGLLQHRHDSSNSLSLKTKSTAVRLTNIVTAKEICSLLRQKFGLPIISSPSSPGNQQPLVHRIHARLNQVRQQSSSNSSMNSSNETNQLSRKQRRKRLLECQTKEDLLVLVATCLLPKNYIKFEHEFDDNSQRQQRHIHQKNDASDDLSTVDKEPFNIIETILPNEIPLQKQDEMLAYIDKLQDMADVEMYGEVGITSRKTPLIHWFLIPCPSHDVPKASVVIDGYCTDIDEDSDTDSCEERLHNTDDTINNDNVDILNWRREIENHLAPKPTFRSAINYCLHKERHRFTILSSFESANGADNSSGYLMKQSTYDKQVWKKVHCVLTENQFWYVSRVKRIGEKCGSRIGKHGIIDLNGSSLIKPDFNSQWIGLPNLFQIATKDGQVHVFQAGNKNAYMRWIQCLTERILLCHENSTFTVTDSMISRDMRETERRCEEYLTETLYSSGIKSFRNAKIVKPLVRLGIKNAEFKHKCEKAHKIYSLYIDSKNREEITVQSTTDILLQSFSTWNTAEYLMHDCNKTVDALFQLKPIDSLKDDIAEAQSDIHQCLRDFQQNRKEYLHNVFDERNHIMILQNLLLPESLFDRLFELLIKFASDY